MITEELVWNQLKELKDTMFGSPLSVVDVGLIYQVQIEQNNVHVVVTQFNRGHIYTNSLSSGVRQKILELAGIGQVSVECVWDPPWTPQRLSDTARKALGFEPDDPVEGRLHVRSKKKADPHHPPFDERPLVRDQLVLPSQVWGQVESLSADRFHAWRGGWRFFKSFQLEESAGLERLREPIHLDCCFEAGQIHRLSREIRLVEEASGIEIPCQVYGVEQSGNEWRCSLVFMADLRPDERKRYLLLYGNPSPACWPASPQSDLVTRGEEYALEIDNGFYQARLSPVMGI